MRAADIDAEFDGARAALAADLDRDGDFDVLGAAVVDGVPIFEDDFETGTCSAWSSATGGCL